MESWLLMSAFTRGLRKGRWDFFADWTEKVYDRVDWGFLSYVLMRMGFGEKRTRWVQECYSTAMFFVMVNGSPHGYMKAQKGLRERTRYLLFYL